MILLTTSVVVILKVQLFPTRVVPSIQVIATPSLSTKLHAEYEQGLMLVSVKY